jgi:hypothetical protein
MTVEPTDNLIYEIDELVSLLERKGYEEEKIIDAMLEYIEISEELTHV